MDNTTVFTGKAQFYNSRPAYPQECIDYIIKKMEIPSGSIVADIGAGTGILTKPFLDAGCTVYAVEPNDDMFAELKKNLSRYQDVRLLQATAEKTDIPALSCDAVVVGTAFHWFDKDQFRAEFQRILKIEKCVAILRIANNTEGDKQLDQDRHITEEELNGAKEFFEEGFQEHLNFEYTERFDEERYINDLLSSATAPLPNDVTFEKYVSRCREIFRKYFPSGTAELPFAVNCYIGRVDTSLQNM